MKKPRKARIEPLKADLELQLQKARRKILELERTNKQANSANTLYVLSDYDKINSGYNNFVKLEDATRQAKYNIELFHTAFPGKHTHTEHSQYIFRVEKVKTIRRRKRG